ncbi:MAG: alanine racemase [Firmicutes bacterium]|nr:alanine racemase [Bacillota bacterium]
MERCVAYIDLNKLLNNYNTLESIGSSSYKVMSVVKANAYGHGSVEVSKHLENHGCQHFGVACLEEALELRNNGIKSMILVFGRSDPSDAEKLSMNNITQTVESIDYAIKLNESGLPINIHINIDSGMSRIGFYCHREENIDSVASQIEQISKMNNLNITGIYTHFEGAEKEDSSHTLHQFNVYMSLIKELEKRKVNVGIRHVCNSSATIKFPEMHLDMVRCGIAIYGYPPVETNLKFEPVMTLASKIISMRNVVPGDSISYGAKYVADKNMTIATVSIGYADGYPRALSNNDFVLLNKAELPVVGTICMDAIMIDTTNAYAKIDDEIILFGNDKSVEILSKKIGTISYEILCNVGKRAKRIYKKTS